MPDSKPRRPRPIRALLALLLAAGCSSQGVASPDYRGEPLATLRGQLLAREGVDLRDGVRLALAWYPPPSSGEEAGAAGIQAESSPGLTRPRSIVTEDVVYEGRFPLDYTFDLFRPPPPEAIGDYRPAGGPVRAAVGILMAYRDGNGNRQLDVVPPEGPPIDKVVGASMGYFEYSGFLVIYLEEEQGTVHEDGLRAGFNLMKDYSVVPLDTPIPLELRDDPELDLVVCDMALTGLDEVYASTPCGIEVEPRPMFAAMVRLFDDGAFVYVAVRVGNEYPTDAQVALEDRDVPFDPRLGAYYLEIGPDDELVAAGQSREVRVAVAGFSEESGAVTVPGEFELLEPAEGAAVGTDSPLTVRWSAAEGTDWYDLRLMGAFGAVLYQEWSWGTEHQIPAENLVGAASVGVSAERVAGSGRNQLSGSLVKMRALSLGK